MAVSVGKTDIDTRTDKLISILRGDARLSVGLSSPAVVRKGVPTQFIDGSQLWVAYEKTPKWEMWGEGHGGEMEVVWRLRFLWRRIGDPEGLEEDVARLTGNVLEILADHVNEAGYWQSLSITGGPAINERTQTEQGHERQDVTVRVKWTHASL